MKSITCIKLEEAWQLLLVHRYQRGHGLGNMLRSLTKFAIPFLKKGAKAVGKQAMKTGMNIAQEVMSRPKY